MSETVEIMRQRLRERVEEKGISPRALSLSIGANHSYVTQILGGKGGMPSADRLARMAEALDTSIDYLSGRSGNPDAISSEVGLQDRHIDGNERRGDSPPIPLVGTGDCADLEVCDESGNMVAIERASFDPDFHVRYLRRPAALTGAREIYALYFHGDSMVPRFRPGEIGLVDPQRPPRPGDDVVVQLRSDDSDDVSSVIVKELVQVRPGEVTLRQHNPPITFTLDRKAVVRIHRIIPQTDLLI